MLAHSLFSRLRPLFFGALLCAGTTGCIKKVLLEGQIGSTRKASVAVNTIGDYEVAEKIAMAGLGQLEGYHYLAPENEDALFMLTRSWASVSLGFTEDAMERAEDAEGSASLNWDYQKRRAEAGYERAIYFGSLLLEKKHPGFEAAKKNADTMKAYAAQFTSNSDAEVLFWVGNAWLGRVNVAKEKPEFVGEAYVGVALVERSVELDKNYMFGTGLTVLGSYHARTPMAELDEAKKLFDESLAISEGKTLMPKVQLAARYFCAKGDKDGYTKALEEVLAAGDGEPYQRLPNTIAKRKAGRWLGAERMKKNCGF